MRKWIWSLLVIATVFVAYDLYDGFAHSSLSRMSRAEELAQEDDLREAVFRHLFTQNASVQGRSAQVYFLAVGAKGEDPDDAFMLRFADSPTPVKKASDSIFAADNSDKPAIGRGEMVITDKATGQPGLLFHTREIKWLNSVQAEVSGGYYEAMMSASGNTYELEKIDDKWVVVKNTELWIS